jgi:hypothetical protein
MVRSQFATTLGSKRTDVPLRSEGIALRTSPVSKKCCIGGTAPLIFNLLNCPRKQPSPCLPTFKE